MGAEYFDEVVEGFDPHVCYGILVRDYFDYESAHEFYGGSIGTTDELKFVRYYDGSKRGLKKAEKEREKLEEELKKRECGVQAVKIGYAMVKVEKKDNKRKAKTRKYEVEVGRWSSDRRDFIEMPEYDERFNSLKEAKEYAEKLFRELPLDYVKLMMVTVKSWDGERVIVYTGKVKTYKRKPKRIPKNARGGTYYRFLFFGYGAC